MPPSGVQPWMRRVVGALLWARTSVRFLWRGVFERSRLELEMREEMDHHVELRTEALMRSGLSRKEASRIAHIEFGHMETYRDAARKTRGLAFLDQFRFSWLDFKLGLRMLVRYPGLTVMSVFAMAAGIAFGAGFLEFSTQWARPSLDFDPDRRMVGVVVDDAESLAYEARLLHDLAAWRGALDSFTELGAMRMVTRNLDVGGIVPGGGGARPESMVEISASAFSLTRTPALMGRTLIETDERLDAPPVVLLGYDLWQDRFGGDGEVVGRTVRLGEQAATVVGVMPDGYGFPRAQSLWVPFRLRTVDFAVDESPGVYVFGRLAPDVSIQQAQAEIETRPLLIGEARPGGGDRLAVRVVPYPELVFMPVPGLFDPTFVYANLFILALVILFCANVALLNFARATSRESELVVRSALGAGRHRIVVQLFTEALVLGVIASVLGLVGARYGYAWFLAAAEQSEGSAFMPFWFVPRLSAPTVVYAVCLTVLGAGVAGVLPALKVTRSIASGLRSQAAGGGGLGFGGIWTIVIVAQIAVTVPLPAFAFLAVDTMASPWIPDVSFSPGEFLTARIAVDRTLESASFDLDTREIAPEGMAPAEAGFEDRYAATLSELERRLSMQPEVAGVAYVSRAPLAYHPRNTVELELPTERSADGRRYDVGRAEVEPQFFGTVGATVLSGRVLDSEDVVSRARVVVVDRRFAESILGGRNPVGLRLRYVAMAGRPPPGPDAPWYEIVGMVDNLGVSADSGGIYHAAARGAVYPSQVIVRLRGDPVAFASRLRSIGADMSATLRVEEPRGMLQARGDDAGLYAWAMTAIVGLTVIALVLSLAGIYSVMAFTVSRRTREIGIRVALGARPRRLLPAILSRPLIQVLVGVGMGALLLIQSSTYLFARRGLTPQEYGLVALHAMLMFCVCMLACIVPTRRALAVEPMEALNVQG